MAKVHKYEQLIIISGAESSGKTTLSQQLAKALGAMLVEEYARTYLTNSNRAYDYQDWLHMAHSQWMLIQQACHAYPDQWVVADTGLLVMKVWAEVRWGRCPAWINYVLQNYMPRHYLICTPDLPWQPDPLREHPNAREQLHDKYLSIAEAFALPYEIIQEEKRIEQALRITQS